MWIIAIYFEVNWSKIKVTVTFKNERGGRNCCFTNKHLALLRVKMFYKPFPKGQILDSSKLKEFADDNFKCNENGRKFSMGRNTMGKGEIAYI